MYSISKRELKTIEDDILTENKSIDVRGWDIESNKADDIEPNISDISNNFCETNRDVYLKEVEGIEPKPNEAMVKGSVCHSIIKYIFEHGKKFQRGKLDKQKIIKKAKKIAQSEKRFEEILWENDQLNKIEDLSKIQNVPYDDLLTELFEWSSKIIENEIEHIEDNWTSIEGNILQLKKIEEFVDGRGLGMGWGRIDLIGKIEDDIIIFDLKTGKPYKENWYSKLQIAGYALAFENKEGIPVDLGGLIFPLDDEKLPRSTPFKDFFYINNELRKSLLKRKEKIINILKKDSPPKKAKKGCKWCSLKGECNNL